MGKTQIRVGLLGFGTVGSAFASLLERQRSNIAARTGLEIFISQIAVRDITKERPNLDEKVTLTDEPHTVVTSSEVDVVVELVGGLDPSKDLIENALREGKPVITANKELLSKDGKNLFSIADQNEVDLLFEAAVAGGVPLIRVLRESLLGEPVEKVIGIVNGTTNYILSQMEEKGVPYDDALLEAQQLGTQKVILQLM